LCRVNLASAVGENREMGCKQSPRFE